MNYQSSGRNQRPKGYKAKQALKFTLLLAICIWLLYQITHSSDEKKDHHGGIHTKLGEGHGAVILGRKVIAGWSADGGDSDSQDVNIVGETEKKEDGVAGNDEIDRNPEEKVEEESYLKENENLATREVKEDQKELEREYKDPPVRENRAEELTVYNDTNKEDSFHKRHENALGSLIDGDDQADVKDLEKMVEEPQRTGKGPNITVTRKRDVAVKDNSDDEVPLEIDEKIAAQHGELINETSSGQEEMEDGVHSFHDENGFPLDVNDMAETVKTQSSDVQKSNLHHETTTSSNNRSRIFEKKPAKRESIESKEGSIISQLQMESKDVIEDSKVETRNEAVIVSKNTEASSSSHVSKTVQRRI